ncbi:MAG: rubrerythrin [Candidatus Methanophagaceae archaeon]|nr:MAG: rubrerythrin [Methanophagales archaeon]
MLSEIPVDLDRVSKADRDKEILRVGLIAELDAVNLYEQLATMAEREEIKRVLLDIAREEKTHVGEFQALLLKEDEEQVQELEHGRREVEEIEKGE